ncbi:hypothetical protein [Agrobacterium pusense]|uniref:hypothetical protein n=1 Tax=Agrobacterium pusense TaxID=648995 RepID=UPI000D349DA6|nr:hypothetical protein [Agrobacterium pusense]PTV70251.1 hypothetical protein DBL06_25645 [Agrobacterium pusense]
MKSPYLARLKAAVTQFEEAYRDIGNCLHWLRDDANIAQNCVGRSISRITDIETLDRLEYEQGVIQEEIMDLEGALEDWQRLLADIEHRLPGLRWHIGEVEADALSFDDFKANEAKRNKLQADALLAKYGLTADDAEALWKQRLAESFETSEFGPIRPVNMPSGVFGAYLDRRVL